MLGFVLAASAQAHSTLERSEPKGGSVLKSAPNELRIWFTQPIKTGLSTVEVRDEVGRQVDRRDLRADEKEPGLVHLLLSPDLGPGIFRVTWTAAAPDMHVTKGSFSFRVAR